MTSRKPASIESLSRRAFLFAAFAGVYAFPCGCAILNRPKPIDPSVFEPAVAKNTKKVIGELTRLNALDEGKKPCVCFIGVKGDSAEPISNETRSTLEEASEIRVIKKADVQAALKDAGIRANDIFIPSDRKRFLNSLDQQVDFLLAGYVEDVEERVDPDDEESKVYTKRVYRLDLVDLDTNKTSSFVADL